MIETIVMPEVPARGADISQSVAIIAEQLALNKVVGLGEAHWFSAIFEHWQSVALHPDVLAQCQDIVLEMGNQKYQQQVDEYTAGSDDVGLQQIRHMLQDSIVFPVWFAAYYIEFFKAVRQVNQQRALSKRPLVKLHVMEPAFNWQDVSSHVDYLTLNAGRDQAFYRYIEKNFISERKPVMAIMGARHLLKVPQSYRIKNVAQLCEQYYPGRLFSVWPHIFKHKILDNLSLNQRATLLFTNSELLCDLTFKDVCPMPQKNMPDKTQSDTLLSDQVDAYLMIKGAKREMTVDQYALDNFDTQGIIAKATHLHDRQKQLLHKILLN